MGDLQLGTRVQRNLPKMYTFNTFNLSPFCLHLPTARSTMDRKSIPGVRQQNSFVFEEQRAVSPFFWHIRVAWLSRVQIFFTQGPNYALKLRYAPPLAAGSHFRCNPDPISALCLILSEQTVLASKALLHNTLRYTHSRQDAEEPFIRIGEQK